MPAANDQFDERGQPVLPSLPPYQQPPVSSNPIGAFISVIGIGLVYLVIISGIINYMLTNLLVALNNNHFQINWLDSFLVIGSAVVVWLLVKPLFNFSLRND